MDTRLVSSVFHVKLQPWKDLEDAVNERWIDMFHASRYNMDLAEFEKATTANKGTILNITRHLCWDGHKNPTTFLLERRFLIYRSIEWRSFLSIGQKRRTFSPTPGKEPRIIGLTIKPGMSPRAESMYEGTYIYS